MTLFARGFEVQHGGIYNALVSLTMFFTVFLITFLKPHRLYKRLISGFFNLNFKYKGGNFKVYHILFLVIGFFGVLFCCIFLYNSFSFKNAGRIIFHWRYS